MSNQSSISIIVPSLNEAKNLPLLLADLKQWPYEIDLLVIDSGSHDCTTRIAKLFGARVLNFPEPNRGGQLHHGASKAIGEWLLFLHADSRLPKDWEKVVLKKILEESSEPYSYFFNFRISLKGLSLRLLEIGVAIRSSIFNSPYGDQGLLIKKNIYQKAGGYLPLNLMEDIEFIQRLSNFSKIKTLGIPLYTNGRRWEKSNVFIQSWKNANLRRKWKRGESSKILAQEYYK